MKFQKGHKFAKGGRPTTEQRRAREIYDRAFEAEIIRLAKEDARACVSRCIKRKGARPAGEAAVKKSLENH